MPAVNECAWTIVSCLPGQVAGTDSSKCLRQLRTPCQDCKREGRLSVSLGESTRAVMTYGNMPATSCASTTSCTSRTYSHACITCQPRCFFGDEEDSEG